MHLTSRDEAQLLRALALALDEESPRGSGPIRLRFQTGLAQQQVETLLERHRDYFARLGQTQRYAINRFEFLTVGELLDDIQRAYEKSRRTKKIALILVVASALLIGLGALA